MFTVCHYFLKQATDFSPWLLTYDSTKTKESRSRVFIESSNKYETIYAENIVPVSTVITPDSKNVFEILLEVNTVKPTSKSISQSQTQSTPIIKVTKAKLEYKLPNINSKNLKEEFIANTISYKISLWPFFILMLAVELLYITIAYRYKIRLYMLKYKSKLENNELLTLSDIFIN